MPTLSIFDFFSFFFLSGVHYVCFSLSRERFQIRKILRSSSLQLNLNASEDNFKIVLFSILSYAFLWMVTGQWSWVAGGWRWERFIVSSQSWRFLSLWFLCVTHIWSTWRRLPWSSMVWRIYLIMSKKLTPRSSSKHSSDGSPQKEGLLSKVGVIFQSFIQNFLLTVEKAVKEKDEQQAPPNILFKPPTNPEPKYSPLKKFFSNLRTGEALNCKTVLIL